MGGGGGGGQAAGFIRETVDAVDRKRVNQSLYTLGVRRGPPWLSICFMH